MDINDIEKQFREKVCKEIATTKEGIDRYYISTPFTFEDGDGLVMILKKEKDKWILTDEGHTFMHLSYFIDIDVIREEGNRKDLVDSILSMYSVKNRNGELVLEIPNGEYGDALFSYVEALIKISDITYLSKEQVESTFIEDFQRLISKSIPEDKITFDWYDAKTDPHKTYVVDCKIETEKRKILLFALNTDKKILRATIILQHFKLLKMKFESIGIFESQEEVADRKAIALFSDAVDKQFSAIEGKENDIEEYLANLIENK